MPAQAIRALEDTFNIIQNVHLGMCYNPKYSKLPFSERDKIIAGWMHLAQDYIADARMATSDFSEFKGKADSYLANPSIMKTNKLMEIIQYSYVWLRSKKRFKNAPPQTLDSMIGGWLGYSKHYIKQGVTGSGDFRKLRGCVDERCGRRRQGNSKKTRDKVRRIYFENINKRGFAELPKLEKDAFVAKKAELMPSTVHAIRLGAGCYKKHGPSLFINDCDDD